MEVRSGKTGISGLTDGRQRLRVFGFRLLGQKVTDFRSKSSYFGSKSAIFATFRGPEQKLGPPFDWPTLGCDNSEMDRFDTIFG